MNNLRDNLRTSPWREALLAGVSAILGILAGPLLGTVVQPFFSPQNAPFITFVIVSLLFLIGTTYSLTIWHAAQKEIAAAHAAIHVEVATLGSDTKALADASGRKVQVLPLAQRYKELQKRVQKANFEILILANYTFDWENLKQGHDMESGQSRERKAYYEALQAKLRRTRGGNFRFVKIIQVPEGHQLEELFLHDPILKEDSAFLSAITKNEPEFVSLRTSTIISRVAFNIFDRASVVLFVEVRDSETGQIDSTSIIIIDDPTSEAIQAFLKVFQRVEAKSKLITQLA